MPDRIQMLTELLAQNPKDAFARYGLAMEHSNAGDLESALREFNTLLEMDPDYSAAHFMAAQALSRAGRTEEARKYLKDGIAAGRMPLVMVRSRSSSVGGSPVGVERSLKTPSVKSRGAGLTMCAPGPTPSPLTPWHITHSR